MSRVTPAAQRQAINVAALAAALVVSQLGLPKAAPSGIVAQGLLTGLSDAIMAVALVLVYRASRVVNFAQTALGAIGAYLCLVLVQLFSVPFLVALPIALAAGALVGLLTNAVVVQRLFNAPRAVLTVATIVVAQFLGHSPEYVNAIPGVGSRVRSLVGLDKLAEKRVALPFKSFHFNLFPLRFGFAAVATVVLSVVALTALVLYLRLTRLGTAIRGAASNAERAQSLGFNVRMLSAVVWTIAGTLAALSLLLRGINESFNVGTSFAPELLLVPLAAAVVADFDNMPVAALTAATLDVLVAMLRWSYPRTPLVELLLLGLIAGVLIGRRRNRSQRSEEVVAVSWRQTEASRPVPVELAGLPEIRRAKRALAALLAVAALLVPVIGSPTQTNLISLVLIDAIVVLSLVVLTGWAGQVSLGQFGLVAIAAVFGANLTAQHHLSFWLTLPLVAAGTGGVAAVLGLPAVRMRGPFLAVTTLAFAVAVERTLFNSSAFIHLIPLRVNRPSLIVVSLAPDRNYYFLCLAALAVAAFVVIRLRQTRFGRVLIGSRDNAPGLESLGIPVVRTQLTAFALAGVLCGVAGVLFVHHQRAIDPASYATGVSIDVVIMAMIGGVTSVGGALLGALYVGIAQFLIPDPVFRNIATSGGLLALLLLAPGGLLSVFTAARDSVLKVLAERHDIVVPSLFADVDSAALEARRVPLAPVAGQRGLAAIAPSRRYTKQSRFYAKPPTEEQSA